MPSAPYLGKTGKVDLDDEVFGEEFHMALVHETVKAEQNARRRGTASTKTRGEVNMTGAKAFRQKGTGRARAGALSTPQRVGGGVAFGPKPRVFHSKVNRKARRRALRCVLSEHLRRGSLAVADPADYDAPSTKKAWASFGDDASRPGKVLLVAGREGEETLVKSYRNIARVTVTAADSIGVCDIIGAGWLVLTPAAIDYLTTIARKERAEVAA
jgi:large subunit ribosomal protein L4